jgi:hypothetical protein
LHRDAFALCSSVQYSYRSPEYIRSWWIKGRSYLCRIIDMLHMGYVDEVLFGEEVVFRLPEIARGWAGEYKRRAAQK